MFQPKKHMTHLYSNHTIADGLFKLEVPTPAIFKETAFNLKFMLRQDHHSFDPASLI